MIALFAVLLAATLLPAAQNVLSHMDKTYAVIEVDLSPIERALPDDIDPVGSIVVELDASIAPKTVANFIDLAESGFYDGLTFHRVMYDFMIQGGDPNGNGTGGSDNPIEGEFYLNGFINPLSHTRGVISMARRGDDFNSATSQFFIMHTSTYSSSLDGQYAAFGWVISGMDYVDAIAAFTYTSDGNGTVPAEYQPKINKITIHNSL
ncbi:MAG: peptidylprolyl isomerase [Firmicutes bacterium]|nr:peptidylprolyl isomerase [Bacillota bacterium]